jgi:metal-sulfur cluster biosynthetic enzyme
VNVEMTLTAPGCGMGEVLKGDVARKIMNVASVKAVNVTLVWEPQWDQTRMSDAAKLQLNML